jgi:hypothetical protein
MARTLEDIFNECYERIRSGESLQSCLRRYPQHAAALEPLLRTTFDIGRRASYIHPRPEFRHWALVRLEGQQNHAGMQRQPAKPGHFSLRQSLAVAIAAVLVLLLAGGGTAAASSNAMPDEPLYPVKLATEEIKLTFAISDAQKAQVHTQLAETRATEVEAMAEKGKLDEAAIAAERFAKDLEKANLAMAKVESFTAGIPVPTATHEPPTPPEGVTEEQTTTTEGQTTTTTEGQTTTTEGQTTTTEGQTTTTTEGQTTTTTEGQTTTTTEGQTTTPSEGQTTTPTDTKRDKWTATSERFKKTLDDSTSKSVEALQNAMEKAPPESKAHWQKSIDKIKETSKDTNKPTPVWPSQPFTQSDNKTGNVWKPNPVNSSQNQPSPPKWPNTWRK